MRSVTTGNHLYGGERSSLNRLILSRTIYFQMGLRVEFSFLLHLRRCSVQKHNFILDFIYCIDILVNNKEIVLRFVKFFKFITLIKITNAFNFPSLLTTVFVVTAKLTRIVYKTTTMYINRN